MNLNVLFASPYGPLLIFACRIVDVSCDTLRVLFAIRGRRLIAAALGFVQALVWIFAVGSAVKHLDSWMHVVGYAAGFATGTFAGITIERLVAYGLATVRIVSRRGGVEIADALRARGYGVTEVTGRGREGPVEIIDSVVRRAHLDEVLAIIDRWDPQAFVTVDEPKVLRGGLLADRDWPLAGALARWSTRPRQRA